jgi:hypothetical protein
MKTHQFTIALAVIVLLACSKKETPSTLTISPNALTLAGDKNAKDSFTITYTGNWSIALEPSSTSWVRISQTSGNGNTKVIVTADNANAGSAGRTVKLTIKPDNNTTPAILNLTQNTYSIQPYVSLSGGSKSDWLQASAPASDGGHVSVGWSESNDGDVTTNKGKRDLWVVRYAVDGSILWQKTFGGTDEDFANAITSLADGSYLITGTTYSNDGDFLTGRGGGDAVVLKIDANGNKIWSRNYGGSDYDAGFSIIPTSDGNFLVGCASHSFDGDINNQHGIPGRGSGDAWIFKINGNGDIIWQKCYGGTGTEAALSVCRSPDGGFVVAAYSANQGANGDVSSVIGSLDFWVFKINATGTLLWNKPCGGLGEDFPFSITPGIDNGYLIAGYSNSRDNNITQPKGDLDGFLTKFDENGNIAWSKNYGSAKKEEFQSITVSNNGYQLVGNIFETSGTNHDAWAVRVDLNGTQIAQSVIEGNANVSLNHVLRLSSGYFIYTGYSACTDLVPGPVKGLQNGLTMRVKE